MPLCRRSRIASWCACTSLWDHRSKALSIESRSFSRNIGRISRSKLSPAGESGWPVMGFSRHRDSATLPSPVTVSARAPPGPRGATLGHHAIVAGITDHIWTLFKSNSPLPLHAVALHRLAPTPRITAWRLLGASLRSLAWAIIDPVDMRGCLHALELDGQLRTVQRLSRSRWFAQRGPGHPAPLGQAGRHRAWRHHPGGRRRMSQQAGTPSGEALPVVPAARGGLGSRLAEWCAGGAVRASLLISPWPAALLIRRIFAANGAKLAAARGQARTSGRARAHRRALRRRSRHDHAGEYSHGRAVVGDA